MNKTETEIVEKKKAKIIVDSRELNGGVPKALDLFCKDVDFDVQTLEVGDYILSDRVAVERKETDDFWKTIFERKELFSQLGDLKKSYERAIMILEGDGLYTRNISPNVVRGILSSIVVDMYIPIIYTTNQLDTAQYLARIAKREQIEERRQLSAHGKRSHMNEDEQREYVISSVCGIGPVFARKLLQHYGSVEAIMTEPEDRLANSMRGMGPKTAEKFRRIVGGRYGTAK